MCTDLLELSPASASPSSLFVMLSALLSTRSSTSRTFEIVARWDFTQNAILIPLKLSLMRVHDNVIALPVQLNKEEQARLIFRFVWVYMERETYHPRSHDVTTYIFIVKIKSNDKLVTHSRTIVLNVLTLMLDKRNYSPS
jgi:hypothetical protein